MPTTRSIPSATLAEIESASTTENILVFVTLDHDVLSEPIRVVSDPVNYVYGSNTYTGFQFDIEILTDDDRPPTARLSVQNVDREIGDALRKITSPMKVTLTIIAGSQFTQSVDPRAEIGTASTMYSATDLELVDVEVTAMFVTGTLRLRDYSQEQWPSTMGTQDRLPGLFR